MEPDPPNPEPLPPLPTRIRFDPALRDVRRQNTSVTLALFVGLLLFIGLCGYKGFAAIGQFLTLTQKSLERRQKTPPTPEPVVIEFK